MLNLRVSSVAGNYTASMLMAILQSPVLSKVALRLDTSHPISNNENRFYRIFPNEKGFKNAQLIQLSKTVYKVSFTKIIDKKNATNYIFVSADDKSTPPVIHDKILSYLIPDDINWDTTFSTNSNEENNPKITDNNPPITE